METLKIATGLMAFLVLGFMAGFFYGYSFLWKHKLSPLLDEVVNGIYELCNENNNVCQNHNEKSCCIKSEKESQSNCKCNHDNVFGESFNNQPIESRGGNNKKHVFCCDKNKENNNCGSKCNCALGKYRKIEKRDIEKVIEKIVARK